MADSDAWYSLSLRRVRAVGVIAATMFLLALPAQGTSVSVDCTGSTAGAFTSLQAAINSLDFVGPHTITMIAGPCVESVILNNRQRITIQPLTSGAGVTIQSPTAGSNVMRISGSTQIVIRETGFTGGSNGININRGSEVQLLDCVITGNAATGVRAADNSTLAISRALIENNGEGIRLSNHVSATILSPTTISNNAGVGIHVLFGSSLRMFGTSGAPNRIEGNGSIGINTAGATVGLQGAHQIRGNGIPGQPFNAGVRVDDNTLFVAAGNGDLEISNNTGAGIEAAVGGAVDLTGTVITGNSEDGVRLLGNSQIGVFPPNTNAISGNGGQGIVCDSTSSFWGDGTGLSGISCHTSNLPFRGGRQSALLVE